MRRYLIYKKIVEGFYGILKYAKIANTNISMSAKSIEYAAR